MTLAKSLPLYPYQVPVRNRDTGECRVLDVQAVCPLDAPAAGAHAAFVLLDWHNIRAWPPLVSSAP